MSILSTTLCFPNSAAPTQGVFIERRLRAIHERIPLRIIAPIPWFPLFKPSHKPSARPPDTPHGPRVHHPRMFYLPGAMKQWDARFYASALSHALSELLDETPIGLIDAHFVWPDGVGAWRVATEHRLPFVCTIRGKLVSQLAGRSKRRQIAEMLRAADALIAVSRSLAKLANEVAGRDLNVHVIPNGVDPIVFHRVDQNEEDEQLNASALPEGMELSSHSGKTRIVISVGHLQALKGFHHLIEIWPEVRRRSGEVRLLLVGGEAAEPAYAHALRAQADTVNRNTQGSTPVVSLLGRQPPNVVARLLNAADLFVLASRSEGWCNAIAESLACGCPVVATNVGGNREVIHDPRLGCLVPTDNQTALTETLCEALNRDWDRPSIASIGGRRDWQQVAAECVDVFRTVLS
ncbi:MAG: glycosyltransferase [Phycisphaerae bacterium]